MKAFGILCCLPLLIVFFFLSGVACAQNPAQENYKKGVEYAIQGEFTKAKEEFEKAIKVDPFYGPGERSLEAIKDALGEVISPETAIHFFKGASYANKGQPDQAIREYTKAIEINPRYADAYYNRGNAYDDKGQHDQAIRDFSKAIEINPRYAQAYLNRGNAYDDKGQHDQAIREYTKAIEINPRYAQAYYNRGNAYRNKGQHDQAIREYTKAIEINPRYVDAYYNRGFLYFVKLGNKVKGCADWKKACELGNCGNYNLAKQKGDCP